MSVLTQIEVNGVTYDLQDAFSGFITNTVNNLVNYYLKEETYTKAEVEALIATIQNIVFVPVTTLPTASADTMNKIYLAPAANPQTQNQMKEYYTRDNGSEADPRYTWELFGSAAIDLTGYVTINDLNTALADYTTTANLTTLLAAKADKSEMGVVDGTGADADKTTITLKTGTSATVLKSHQNISGKADKVNGATNGNFAGLDANGNLTDSGSKASDFATSAQGALADTALQPADITTLEGKVEAIEGKIPTEASSSNQLADKNFVNSSISTATATFKGSFNLVSDLSLTTSATQSQIATALGTAISTADNNDYAFVQIPTSDATPTEIARVERYKYNGSAWAFEYALNNSGFTAAQWAALNSGITSGLVSKLSDLPTNSELTNLLAGKYTKPANGIPASDIEAGVIPAAVEANPTVPSGTTPTDLAGLKVGNNYYGIPQLPTVDNTPTANSNNLVKSGGVYSEIHPAVASTQPQGGFLPNVVYDLGTLTGTVTFALAAGASGVPNPYHWTFDTGSTAPTITWPSNIVWPDGVTPTVDASKHYEVFIRNGYASMLVYSLT